MAFVYPDRASEVTTSTGDQGDIILQGPEPSFWSFTSRMAVGDETTVCREDGLTSELVRVRLVAPDRLRYLAVYGSSNGGARVVWPAGQQRVYATQLGRYALLPPDAGQAGRPVVVQPDGTYGAGALTVPVPTGLTLGTLLDAASAGGRPDGGGADPPGGDLGRGPRSGLRAGDPRRPDHWLAGRSVESRPHPGGRRALRRQRGRGLHLRGTAACPCRRRGVRLDARADHRGDRRRRAAGASHGHGGDRGLWRRGVHVHAAH
ncbi:hypothetical protein [Azospirillum baldaniorum]|uniref:Uncharacterized protein n=1 Tax=Azospirillum baldaniorum TaxID=1064539 RepID=A0A9P1JZ82_9PROT|nr:hypothetical protein [Azospirillum baldaniorum]CCD02640.1 protein of unknown function [Azospirillum baldaniorum]